MLYFCANNYKMTLEQRISALSQLGNWFRDIENHQLESLVQMAVNQNNWFTKPNVVKAIQAWGAALQEDNVVRWVSPYQLNPDVQKKVGLVLAGNIPLVGLHDLLSVIISGHQAHIKYSSQDRSLMSAVTDQLKAIDNDLSDSIIEIDQLKDIDAVIATGSDNSARYFKYYFSRYPHIIRQNRVSVGILSGKESAGDLQKLGIDIFQYFGLGCRNVAKVFVPSSYPLPELIDALKGTEGILEHHKYRNNYDYNKSIYLVNKEPHLDSGFFLMRESSKLVSPISVIFYEHYENEAELSLKLSAHRDKIQCMVSDNGWYEGSLPFGTAQEPELWDYADGVDTLEFLNSI